MLYGVRSVGAGQVVENAGYNLCIEACMHRRLTIVGVLMSVISGVDKMYVLGVGRTLVFAQFVRFQNQ